MEINTWGAIIVALIAAVPGLLAFIGGMKKSRVDVAQVVEEVYSKVLEKMRAEIERLEKDIVERDELIDNLTSKVETLGKENEELREKVADLQHWAEGLLQQVVALGVEPVKFVKRSRKK